MRMAIEELGCRRDDGENNFTAQEPAVERLLNALDFVLNSDVQEPGEFYEVIKCASEQHSLNRTMREPIEEVEGFHRQDKQDNFRLWLVSCLNRPGSLKLSLQIALPMHDVVQCFVQRNSIIFMESFADELLGTLSQLHNHPTADGLTTFKLDASCLQLFQDRSIEVHVESKRRQSRVVVPRRGTLLKSNPPTAPPVRVDVVKFERASQTEIISEPAPKVSLAPAPATRNILTTENSCNTEYPSSFLTFAELMELQAELEVTKSNTKNAFDRAKVLESGVEDLKQEYTEKLDMLTTTLRKMKALYAELFQSSVESTGDLTEDMVDPHIRDIFAVLRGGTVTDNRPTVPQTSKDPPPKPQELAKRDLFVFDDNPTVALDQPVAMPRCTIVLSEVVEKDRSVQLKLQDNKCAGCQSVFGDTGDANMLFKVVQKAGETLRLQKPRRCHYCSELFCHRCHTNKTSILPFRVLQRWDFTAQHVCNRDYEFLSKNFDKSIYLLTSLPRELQDKPAIVQCGSLRKKLAICGRLIAGCTHSSSKLFVQFLHGHYSCKELFYSLSDFSKLRMGDSRMSVVSNAVSTVTNIVPGLPSTLQSGDLISDLMGLVAKTMQHVKECPSCAKRGSARCLLCTDPDPACVAEDEVTQCPQCRNIYHTACLSSMNCRVCSQK